MAGVMAVAAAATALLLAIGSSTEALPDVESRLQALEMSLHQLREPALLGAPPAPPPPAARLADRYDVRTDFGAAGDGIHDDTKPIQAGIDAAIRAGTVVFIPRGTYRVTAPLLINLGTYGIESALRIESDWATIRYVE